MKTVKLLFGVCGLLGAVVLDNGCISDDDSYLKRNSAEIEYPYLASPEKVSRLKDGVSKIVKGMPAEKVKELLGEPDEINKSYGSLSSLNERKASGYSYVYLIKRQKPQGGMLERKEKLYRIYFDKDNNLTRIEKIGVK
jgi:outer membrane protein assembly factor BamE (lipoprotein component of BamABCDE complex)